MSITLERDASGVKIIEIDGYFPTGRPVKLYTEDELNRLAAERKAMLDLQMPSFIRGDEDEDARDLF
ncbi:MAG: hypothetical protein HC904_11205 [Blastochloris sp.]|nr:hypothetical protein [Blastochloris sp.]